MANKVWNIARVIAGVYIVFIGVRDIDSANTWLVLVRGLFWISIGGLSFWGGMDNLKGNHGE